MANTLDSINGSSSAYTNTGTAKSATDTTQVTKNMFLQILVAQIKNQDPTNPSDGVQFLTQLAQFQQLENGLNMAEDVAAIRGDLEQTSSTPPAAN